MQKIEAALQQAADPERAKNLQRFFKTGKGEYGEGDVFLGISVPEQRKIVQEHWRAASMTDVKNLLNSEVHEKRLVSLLILVEKFKRSSPGERAKIADFYLKNAKKVNNWDLVDLSAHKILGAFLLEKRGKKRQVLSSLARSKNLWERRISIISTAAFIQNQEYKDTLRISELLLCDEQDLIHKAVGWMLREVGNRDRKVEEEFLDRHAARMPRTMLRYAIEKFPENRRKFYLGKGGKGMKNSKNRAKN